MNFAEELGRELNLIKDITELRSSSFSFQTSLSDVDCNTVKVFLKEAGEGSDLGVGFTNGCVSSVGDRGVLSSDVAKQ